MAGRFRSAEGRSLREVRGPIAEVLQHDGHLQSTGAPANRQMSSVAGRTRRHHPTWRDLPAASEYLVVLSLPRAA